MGKATKALKAFIEGIPDTSLARLSMSAGTIYSDTDFRLDMQGVRIPIPFDQIYLLLTCVQMTTAQEHNLQVQVNKGTSISTLKKVAPATVAGPVLVPSGSPWSAADIRAQLLAKILI